MNKLSRFTLRFEKDMEREFVDSYFSKSLKKIRISCYGLSDTHCSILINVSDTGVGIVAHELDKIFIPFVQGDDHQSHTVKGTGYGNSNR